MFQRISKEVQTEENNSLKRIKKAVYERVENETRYTLIQIVMFN